MKLYEKKLPPNRLVAEGESENSAKEGGSASYALEHGVLEKSGEEDEEYEHLKIE